MKDNELSITCPNCGKLNVIGSKCCSNCGQPLPVQKQWEGQQHRPLSKRVVGVILTVAAVLAIGLLGLIIQHNQVLSYTTFLNEAPQKVIFYDVHRHPVKTLYLIGDRRKKTNEGIQGTLVISKKVRIDKNYRSLKPVHYTDNRQHGLLEVQSDPVMKFYYPSRSGKLKLNGRCEIVGHPEIKYFSWQGTSGGVTK
ncbi:MAG: zinc ribbon domain-containing protein [Lactobacillaceae bacterium]|nr:zinc ribbon domain-containing protein [Lactobacillaceae bacterium]